MHNSSNFWLLDAILDVVLCTKESEKKIIKSVHSAATYRLNPGQNRRQSKQVKYQTGDFQMTYTHAMDRKLGVSAINAIGLISKTCTPRYSNGSSYLEFCKPQFRRGKEHPW